MAEIIDRKSVITSFEADTKGLEKGAADSKKLVNSVQDVSAKTNTALKSATSNVKQLANEQLKLGQTMRTALGPVGGIVTRIGSAFLGVLSSVRAATLGVRAFTIALISTGIGAIVVAIGALIAAFLSTERGSRALSKEVNRLKVIFDSLLGGLQDLSFKAVGFFKKLFEDPQEALKDLGQLIKTELIERFEALKLIGPALALILSGQKGSLRAGLELLANTYAKVAFGVDNATGKFNAAIETADKLTAASVKLEEQEKRLALEVARLGSAYQDAREQATDIEIGAVRQLEASQRARALNLQISQKQVEVERTKLAIQKLQNSTSDTGTKAQQQELDTQARIESLQNSARRENERFLRREAGLRKQIVDEIQKARALELSAPEALQTGVLVQLERQILTLQRELQKAIVQGNEKAVDEAISAIKKVEEEILRFKVSIGDKSAIEQFLEIRADRKAKIESDIQATFARITAKIAAADAKRIADEKAADDQAAQDKIANVERIKGAALGAIDSLAQLNQQQVDNLNNALQFQSERVSRFEELAETGSARQVIIEEDRLAKLEEARAKAVEKQKRLADAQILINQAITISESVKAIATAFGTAGPLGIITGIATSAALGIALASAASSVSGLFGSLPAFAKGTDVLDGKGTGTSDSILARLSKGERVTDAATNKRVNSVARGVFPNKLLPDAVRAYMSTPEIGAAMAGLASTTERGFKELLEEQKQTRIALQRLKVTTSVRNGEIATLVSQYNKGEAWRRI